MSLRMSIGAGGETGPLEKSASGLILENLALFAEFHNPGSKPLSALIDAKPLTNGEYDLEVTTMAGEPLRLERWGGCGTTAPLMDHEIFTIAPGASARVRLSLGFYFLAEPGTYRLRVRYKAHRSSRGDDAESAAKEKLRHLWTGTLESDWITVTILPR